MAVPEKSSCLWTLVDACGRLLKLVGRRRENGISVPPAPDNSRQVPRTPELNGDSRELSGAAGSPVEQRRELSGALSQADNLERRGEEMAS